MRKPLCRCGKHDSILNLHCVLPFPIFSKERRFVNPSGGSVELGDNLDHTTGTAKTFVC